MPVGLAGILLVDVATVAPIRRQAGRRSETGRSSARDLRALRFGQQILPASEHLIEAQPVVHVLIPDAHLFALLRRQILENAGQQGADAVHATAEVALVVGSADPGPFGLGEKERIAGGQSAAAELEVAGPRDTSHLIGLVLAQLFAAARPFSAQTGLMVELGEGLGDLGTLRRRERGLLAAAARKAVGQMLAATLLEIVRRDAAGSPAVEACLAGGRLRGVPRACTPVERQRDEDGDQYGQRNAGSRKQLITRNG